MGSAPFLALVSVTQKIMPLCMPELPDNLLGVHLQMGHRRSLGASKGIDLMTVGKQLPCRSDEMGNLDSIVYVYCACGDEPHQPKPQVWIIVLMPAQGADRMAYVMITERL